VITGTPALTPVTIPLLLPTVAAPPLLLHAPPLILPLNVVVSPIHTEAVPLIVGVAVTLIVVPAEQPLVVV
jgi:hypothetical protein